MQPHPHLDILLRLGITAPPINAASGRYEYFLFQFLRSKNIGDFQYPFDPRISVIFKAVLLSRCFCAADSKPKYGFVGSCSAAPYELSVRLQLQQDKIGISLLL